MKQSLEDKIKAVEKTIAKYPNGNATPTLKRFVIALKKEVRNSK